ncbi:hypothetical protein GQ600_26468 [Phytophthora cactorum]|nr:hypothetical protein GQ600_26468 [Phytophthora cactorum]
MGPRKCFSFFFEAKLIVCSTSLVQSQEVQAEALFKIETKQRKSSEDHQTSEVGGLKGVSMSLLLPETETNAPADESTSTRRVSISPLPKPAGTVHPFKP